MANTYKDIVITPNKGSATDDPKIVFSGGNTSVNTDITLRVYPDANGTLSFEGSAGQLFSITNDLTGSVFSVNDISGIPLIDVNPTTQQITLAQYYGNVGIGTSTATYKLEVGASGVLSLNDSTNANKATLQMVASGLDVYTGASKYIRFGTNSSEAMRITSAGYVGIGTSAPSNRLETREDTSYPLAWGSSSTLYGWLSYTTGMAAIGSTSGNGILLYANGAERMRIDANGWVGINTSTPSAMLHVNALANGALLSATAPTSGTATPLDIYANASAAAAVRLRFGTAANYFANNSFIEAQTTTATTSNMSLGTSGQTRMHIDSSGNVGIGTTSPGTKLEVIGQIRSKNVAGDVGGLRFWSDVSGNGNIFEYYNAALIFGTGDTERMRILANGNVGIGISNPSTILELGAANTTNQTIKVNSVLNSGFYGAWSNAAFMSINRNPATGTFVDTSKAAAVVGLWTNTNDSYITFGTTSTNNADPIERMRISNTGNVGINTTLPVTRLHINAEVVDDYGYAYDANSVMFVHPTPTGATTLNDPKTVLMLARQGTGGQAYGAAATFNLSRYENAGGGFVGSRTRLDFTLAHDQFIASNNTVMTLLSAGRVGIGTSSPANALNVYVPNGNDGIRIDNGSNTASDYAVLDFRQAGMQKAVIYTNQESLVFKNSTPGNTIFIVGSTERMRIDNTGNVGVGATAPSAKLHVQGATYDFLIGNGANEDNYYTAGTSGTHIFRNGTTQFMRITSTGLVGIATTSPTANLHVVGTANITTSITTAGSITDSIGNVRDIPVNEKVASYVLTVTDAGKTISTNNGITVPNAVFSSGQTVSMYNNSAASITVTQAGSVTMYLGGTATTGNRTLAQRGLATVLCISANTFVITGMGLT